MKTAYIFIIHYLNIKRSFIFENELRVKIFFYTRLQFKNTKCESLF